MTRLLLCTAALTALLAGAFVAVDARASTQNNPEEQILRKIAQTRSATWRLTSALKAFQSRSSGTFAAVTVFDA